MKPTRNHQYCPESGKRKILFDTEEKAKNFIKYNWRELTDNRNTLRFYYCIVCGGWHITSHSFKRKCKSRSERVIHNIKHGQDKLKSAKLKKQQERDERMVQRELSPNRILAKDIIREFGIIDKLYIHEYCKQHNLSQDVRTQIGDVAKKRRMEKITKKNRV